MLGHKSGRITTHYSAAEIVNLLNTADKVCKNIQDINSPTLTLLKCANAGSIPVRINDVGQYYVNENLHSNCKIGSVAPAKVPQVDLGELTGYDASHVNQQCARSSVG